MTFAAVWLVAAAVAVAISWQGVGIVTSQVTDERPASLSADEVRELAGGAGSTATTTPSVSTADPTTTAAPPSATMPSTTAPATSAPAETRTYNVVGGSVALRFLPQGVTVVWATPNAGFSVDVEPENGNGVQVEFESDTHRSRVDGWWADGPQDRVREDPR